MEILKYDKETADDLIKRSQADINEILSIVQDILSDVKENRDEAVKRYTAKFDRCELDNLKVSEEEIREAYDNLDTDLIEALKSASENIKKFHKAQIPEEWSMEVSPGVTAGQIIRPINSVGCYIPGGRAAYPSSILMEVIPAINSRGYYSAAEKKHKYFEDATGEEAEWINKYEILQYNNMFDLKEQSEMFFPYFKR